MLRIINGMDEFLTLQSGYEFTPKNSSILTDTLPPLN